MRNLFNFLLFTTIILIFSSCQEHNQTNKPLTTMSEKTNIEPPLAKKVAEELSIHGDTRTDNYFWMKLSDEQKNKPEGDQDQQTQDVISWLNAENDYRENLMSHTKGFQEKLYDEIVGRINQTDVSVPYSDNGYFYYSRYEEGKEYRIYARKRQSLDADEEIMLNVNELAEGFSFYNIGSRVVSPDNNILAYGVDTLSRRIYDIKFKNLNTGEELIDVIPSTTSSVAWANDNKTLFYTKKEPGTLRSYKIFRHVLGTDATQDVEIFHESDDGFGTFVYRSKSGDYIFIGSYSILANEYHFVSTDNPYAKFKTIESRPAKGQKLEYSIDHYEDRFYILTNHNAENFKLVSAPVSNPGISNWTDVISHREDVLLEDMELFKNYLVLNERINGITELRIIPWDKSAEHYIKFEEAAHLIYASVNRDFNTDVLRFGYTSMKTPNSIYDYNMNDLTKELMKQQEVVSDTFSPDQYETERIWATAKDGVKVPISMVYKKGFKRDGTEPLLLYAYGSYGSSMDPYFSSPRLSLLDRGVTFAIAHIRGGSEMGRQWYEDGKMFKKKNTFTDFIDCADYLVNEKYTSREKLFAMGGSAGGLLMGAVVNMRPELFKGVVAAVPFVDVVSTMLDESIPLTTGEFDEWGNPKNKDSYEYMKSYSPYDNVDAKNYPYLLVTTGLHDSQVQYWEPAKWVAKLREYKTGNNPLLLYTNMDAGHGGASGRFAQYKETAMEYAFIFDILGINEGDVKG